MRISTWSASKTVNHNKQKPKDVTENSTNHNFPSMSFGKAPKRRQRKNHNIGHSERKSRDAGSKSSSGSKSSYGNKTEEVSSGTPYFIYKRVIDLADNTAMDEGISRVLCQDQCGANATAAVAMYSWLLRNVQAWGADQVKTTFLGGVESGIACMSYESVVLMKNSEEKTISAEFYGKAC